jgi:hypothetical protein
MIRKTALLSLVAALGLGLLTACSLISSEKSFAATHPQALGAGRPVCSECHGTEAMKGNLKSYASLDHTATFVKEHRIAAGQDSATCATCHSQSFCADCHGGKTVMKPSAKLGNRPDREIPHRGNYLSMHRIEGKADPTSCFKCHGRANNEKCMTCHK